MVLQNTKSNLKGWSDLQRVPASTLSRNPVRHPSCSASQVHVTWQAISSAASCACMGTTARQSKQVVLLQGYVLCLRCTVQHTYVRSLTHTMYLSPLPPPFHSKNFRTMRAHTAARHSRAKSNPNTVMQRKGGITAVRGAGSRTWQVKRTLRSAVHATERRTTKASNMQGRRREHFSAHLDATITMCFLSALMRRRRRWGAPTPCAQRRSASTHCLRLPTIQGLGTKNYCFILCALSSHIKKLATTTAY